MNLLSGPRQNRNYSGTAAPTRTRATPPRTAPTPRAPNASRNATVPALRLRTYRCYMNPTNSPTHTLNVQATCAVDAAEKFAATCPVSAARFVVCRQNWTWEFKFSPQDGVYSPMLARCEVAGKTPWPYRRPRTKQRQQQSA